MSNKGIKYQVTMPKGLSDKIEKDIEGTYMTKSAWFIKLVKDYFDRQEQIKKNKKVIDLNIN